MDERIVEIPETCARILVRVFEDVCDMEKRAKCSDEYFRKHFVMMVKDPYVVEAKNTLADAYDKAITSV